MYLYITIVVLLLSYFISRQKPKYRKVLITINTVISIVYIVWRFTVIPINNGMFSFIMGTSLYLAEIVGLIAFLNFKFLFTREYKIEKKSIKDFVYNRVPNVDVLICTYNEPLDLLEKTIVASIGMEYDKNNFKVYVCDDGRRESLKRLFKKYKVNYITREDNEGAKAGNINNALKYIKGDLFAVLDADMIPKKDFLSKTVGYFVDENLAFVQTPQVYYNQDMYQYNLNKNIPNEQDFFMREIEEARASINAVLHVGTNAVFKRSAVEEIGGYPTCSITEDMAVGMLLQSKGYTTMFINEVLVLGLSATTFSELVKQRDRWCRGNLQVLKKFNPLFTKGLTLSQKIAYLDGSIYWFSSLQKLIYIICPLIYLITQNLIINADAYSLISMFVPYLLGQILIFNTLSPKTRSVKWAHYYEMAMAPHISLSVLKEMLSIKVNFNVTSKDITNDRKQFQFRIAMPHIVIILLTLIGWYISGKMFLEGDIHVGAYLINMAWSTFNFIGAIICIKVAYQKPIFRNTERIEVVDDIRIELEDGINRLIGKVVDISEKGVGIKLSNDEEIELGNKLDLVINGIKINCKVARKRGTIVGLTYDNLNVEQMKMVMDIYVDNMSPYYDPKRTQRYVEDKNIEKSLAV